MPKGFHYSLAPTRSTCARQQKVHDLDRRAHAAAPVWDAQALPSESQLAPSVRQYEACKRVSWLSSPPFLM